LLVAQIHDDLGHPDEARSARTRGVGLAERRLDLEPDDLRALYMGANGLVAIGQREKGLGWARRALELEPDDPMLLYNVACIYALAERADSALDCLERAIERGFAHRPWLERDSNLDFVRGNARFVRALERMG
jgi:tetratricopeptide (TPR) repeat protein